ncbi:MAG: cyclodeaminase/cyclohydrolase family protein [Vicinamibacterales bacterium]|jgi:formiminotetrahydrofolate cyclodeaminase|nr:cyclodeaminase/cyclohydrolase family protein [Vicinamibacterales bacterium]
MERPVRDLLEAFAASTPTPGGGSAAALAGAVGASLLRMVAGMPRTRTGVAEERVALDGTLAALDAARARLAALVDEDTAAYDGVMAAFKLPKATDQEKATRREAIQRATRVATETPLAVMRASAGALAAGAVVASHGNRNAASDVRVGIALLLGACEGAHENVSINVPGLAESERAPIEAEAAACRAASQRAAAEARGALS